LKRARLTKRNLKALEEMQDSSVAQPKSLGYKLKSARSKQTTHETESGMSTIRSTYSSIPNTKARHRTKQFSLQYTNPAFRNGLSDIMNHGATSGLGDAGVIHAQHRVPEFISSIILKLSETSATPGCIPTELESAIHTCSDSTEHIPVEAYASTQSTLKLITYLPLRGKYMLPPI
jgi:hypothetical protein